MICHIIILYFREHDGFVLSGGKGGTDTFYFYDFPFPAPYLFINSSIRGATVRSISAGYQENN